MALLRIKLRRVGRSCRSRGRGTRRAFLDPVNTAAEARTVAVNVYVMIGLQLLFTPTP